MRRFEHTIRIAGTPAQISVTVDVESVDKARLHELGIDLSDGAHVALLLTNPAFGQVIHSRDFHVPEQAIADEDNQTER